MVAPVNDCTKATLVISSVLGGIRGAVVQALLSPLEVVKIRQQCSDVPEKSLTIARKILQEEGWSAFYKGIEAKLANTVIKQFCVWPIIRGGPFFLERHGIKGLRQEVLTGLAIAVIDASLSSPFDKARIISAHTGKNQFSIKSFHKKGWQGFPTQLAKLSVHWVVFLVAQKSLRDRYRNGRTQKLNFPQLLFIGTQVAVITSLVSAPFDIANTRKQAQNRNPSHLLSGNILRNAFRGAPISLTSNLVHYIASLILIEHLK